MAAKESGVTPLIKAQVEYCTSKGFEMQDVSCGMGRDGRYHVSIPYAGANLQLQVIVYAPRAVRETDGEDDEDLDIGGLDDDDALHDEQSRSSSTERSGVRWESPLPEVIPVSVADDTVNGYDVWKWSNVGEQMLAAWDIVDPQSLYAVLRVLVKAFTEFQADKARSFPNHRVAFDLEILCGWSGAEILTRTTMAAHEALAVVPLYEEATSTDVMFGGPQMRLQLLYRVLPSMGGEPSDADAHKPDVKILVPESLPLAKKLAASPPPYHEEDTTAAEYAETVREMLSGAYSRRRDLIKVLMANFTVLEIDAKEFSAVLIQIRVRRPNCRQTYSFSVRIELSSNFPSEPPSVFISDWTKQRYDIPLDKSRYRYSPRWDAKRMATELMDHIMHVATFELAPNPVA